GLAAGAPAGATVEIGGVPHVPLRSLAPQGLRFDEKRLALEVTLAPELLLKRTFDLAPRRPGAPAEPGGEPGAVLHYRLSSLDGNGGAPPKLSLATELAVHAGDFLFRHESIFTRQGDTARGVRLATQLVHDRPADQQRFIFGDHTASTGDLGS